MILPIKPGTGTGAGCSACARVYYRNPEVHVGCIVFGAPWYRFFGAGEKMAQMADAGNPRAARAVGNIMREARAAGVPYHRVIAAGGALGGFGGNIALKRSLLMAEGVTVSGRRVKHFAAVKWP